MEIIHQAVQNKLYTSENKETSKNIKIYKEMKNALVLISWRYFSIIFYADVTQSLLRNEKRRFKIR